METKTQEVPNANSPRTDQTAGAYDVEQTTPITDNTASEDKARAAMENPVLWQDQINMRNQYESSKHVDDMTGHTDNVSTEADESIKKSKIKVIKINLANILKYVS